MLRVGNPYHSKLRINLEFVGGGVKTESGRLAQTSIRKKKQEYLLKGNQTTVNIEIKRLTLRELSVFGL